jgi:uncharacterized protein (TIRG00374 family)
LAIGAAIVAIAIVSRSGVSASLHTIGRMDRWWLAGAAGAEILTYIWFSLALRLLAGPRVDARRGAPFRTALVVFGLGNVLPAAPAEGLVMAGAALKRRQMDPRRIAGILGCSQWFNNRALLAIAAVDVLAASVVGDVARPYEGGAVAGAVVMLCLLALTAWLSLRRATAEWFACVLLRVRYRRACPSRAVCRQRGAEWHRVALETTGERPRRILIAATSMAAWMCDGLCMYLVLRAGGVRLELDQVILAYTAGAISATVPLVPAGLGVVETVTPLLLTRYGVAWNEAIAAVVVYRLVSTVLPAGAGLLAFFGLRLGPWRTPATSRRSARLLAAPGADRPQAS